MGYNTLVTFTAGNALPAADLNNNFANSDYLLTLVKRASVAGELINGYISRTVASNNLTAAIKTIGGSDPSSTDPTFVRIGNSVREITAALSVTVNAGSNTFDAGCAELAALDQDLFVYLGWRASTSSVFILVSRMPYGVTYADFSSTSTAETYGAYSGAAPASTDVVELAGRFSAQNSGTASYNWSIPTTDLVVSRPIFESRWLTWTPTLTGFSSAPTSAKYRYRLINTRAVFYTVSQDGNGTSNTTAYTMTVPFTTPSGASTQNTVPINYVDNSATGSTPGRAYLPNSSKTITLGTAYNSNTWTGSGGKRAYFEMLAEL